MQEAQKWIDPQDIESFFESQICRKAAQILKNAPHLKKRPTSKNICLVRNYLIAKLIINNSLRPCALYKLKVDQIDKAIQDRETKLWEVPLFYDKNMGATALPSYLHLTDDEKDEMIHFISFIRPCVIKTGNSTDDLFTLTNGERLGNIGLSRCWRSIWTSAGHNNESFPATSNSRHIRKSSNALMLKFGSDKVKTSIPDMLNHHPETSRKSYSAMCRPQRIAEAKLELRSIRAEKKLSKSKPKSEKKQKEQQSIPVDSPLDQIIKRKRKKPTYMKDYTF